MSLNKASSKIYSIAKSTLAAAVLPVFIIYIMVGKPDYRIMNGLAHIILPAAEWVSDGITWPIRAIKNASSGIRELSNLRSENEELRIKLDAALQNKNDCDIAISENQKLNHELDIVKQTPQRVIVARITENNKAFHHNTFFIDKGKKSGIESGQVAISFDGKLVGMVSDVSDSFARVRALNDSKSNIPVRVAGSEVYGFLRGNGTDIPSIGFFSDPEFQSTSGLRLVTSKIGGVLPDGILVGETKNESEVNVLSAGNLSSVMILKFDNKDTYK